MTATYSKPTKIPRWADTSTNIVEPLEGKKDEGWLFEEVPPSSWENWRTNLIGSWAKWLDERFFDGASKDELLIKSPGSAVNALRITDTYVKSHLDFRVEGDDLGMEVDGVASRRIYFDASKLNWLGYNLSTARMELYSAGVLALWADATQCYINGDIVIGDDLGVPGGLAVGIASPTYADDVIQLGDANSRWEFNSGNPQFVFDHFGGAIDALKFDRTGSYFSWLVANTEEARLSASGLAIENGLYVGSAAGTPVDNAIIAEGSGGFGNGLRIGFAGAPINPLLEIGDTSFYIRLQSGTTPTIAFDSNDGMSWDRSLNRLQINVNVAPKFWFDASGLCVMNGLYVGGSSIPVDDTITCEAHGVFHGGLRVGFSGVPTNDRIELGDPNLFLQWSADVCELDFASGASFSYSRTNLRYAWLISTTEEMRLTANGLAIGNGLYVGDVTGVPTDNEIYAEGNVKAMGGSLYLGADDYVSWDGTSWKWILNNAEEARLTANGLAITNGLYVGSAAGVPTDNKIYAEGDIEAGVNAIVAGGLRVGFTGTPTADRVEIGDAAFYAELATDAIINFDSTDYIKYSRSSDRWEFWVSTVNVMNLAGTGMVLNTIGLTVNGGDLRVGTFDNTKDLILASDAGIHPNQTTKGHFHCSQLTGRLRSGDGTNVESYPVNFSRALVVMRSSLGVISSITVPAGITSAGSLFRVRAYLIIDGGSGTIALKMQGVTIGSMTWSGADRMLFQSEFGTPSLPSGTATMYGGTFEFGLSFGHGVVNIATLVNTFNAIPIDVEITSYVSGNVTLACFTVDLI